ncbi:DUF2637 domain-containing protein [Streptomyces paromomycinus]|uniref:Chromosome partition protein Smc n=2 Tax=Streptomyces paromomycinus TaxID=92743 RepID=A0A401W4B6_STREY|nr:DUF2637 domain-containing protein [Streptomyces paromomycinus]GCD44142.1 chromosome partition protein Smc [Streptomyces paromomycinus]
MTGDLFTSWPGLTGGSPWLLLPLAVTALAAVALVVWRLRRSVWLAGIGPQAVVALGGVAVSVYGLWGFATETVHLPEPLAVAFICVFDAAEMVLLVMLYRAADPDVGWTRELRLMHRTAWTLVAFSGAMNAVHAPNWWARPVLAAVPALAAWLIELQLRSKLHAVRTDEDDDARPGPARLLALLWQHAWAAVFALLGLDARSSSSAITRAAQAQRAAQRVYRLRLALENPAPAVTSSPRALRRSGRRTERLRRRAQTALDRADVGTDTRQSLALAQRMTTLTRAAEVALLDYTDTPKVVATFEGLAVTPAADRITASAAAREAEDARQRADAARVRAESERQEADAARQRAEEELSAARQELARVEDARRTLLKEQEDISEQTEDARQRAADARQDIDAARQRAAALVDAARTEADRTRRDADQALAEVRAAAGEQQRALDELTGRTDKERGRLQQYEGALQQLKAQVQEATLVRDRLRGDLAALAPQAPDAALSGDGPVFRSEAKEAGWHYYLHALEASQGQQEPGAADLAERFGVDAGNARNWLRDFRAARAAQLAARPPRAAAHTDHQRPEDTRRAAA